jgi:hypothetical protein
MPWRRPTLVSVYLQCLESRPVGNCDQTFPQTSFLGMRTEITSDKPTSRY